MIKAKEGKCSDCPKVTKLIAKRCQFCYWKHRNSLKKPDPPEKVVPRKTTIYFIPKQSKKRKAQNVLYLKKRRTFMEQNTKCQAQLSGCSYTATEVHHKQGRTEGLLTDEAKFLAVCRNCHDIIEAKPTFAKEKGFSLNRI